MKSYPWDSVVSGLDANGYPILDRAYSAADLRDVYSAFLTEGVFMDGTGGLAVTAGEGMSVVVAAGRCFVRGAIGVEPSARELALQAASSADRIDAVVLRWDASIEARSIDLYVKTGVAASVPTRPALTRSETVWELGLADVFVPASSTAVSAERITDTRLEAERCGAVAPFAPVDTDTFFDQIQAAIDKQTAELQAQTDRAVELAEKAVDETLAGELRQEIEDLVARAAHPGVIYPFGGSVLPPNFLWCDGAEHSRADYPELFAAIGTAYGAGDGSTTFNVPDLRGRVPMGTSDTHPMGETGGEEKHAQTVEEMPIHNHKQRLYATGSEGFAWGTESKGVTSSSTGYGGYTAEEGGSQPFNVMQPYTATQYIIATGKGGGVNVAEIVQGAQALPLGTEYGGTGATNLAEFGRSMAAHANEMQVVPLGASRELIPQDADLNDYTAAGSYYSPNAATTKSLSNFPDDTITPSFVMEVSRSANSAGEIVYATQNLHFVVGDSARSYRRLYVATTDTWYDWYCTSGVDSIVAQGTSGGWDYIKYANGIGICAKNATIDLTSGFSSWGSGYTSVDTFSAAYPFTWVSRPVFAASVYPIDANLTVGAVCSRNQSYPDLLSYTPSVQAFRSSEASATTVVDFTVIAIGRWR